MKETDTGQIGLGGTGGQALDLHILHIGSQMLAADVCQLLKMKLVGEESAEPPHGGVVAALGELAPLPVVPGDTVQLGNEAQEDANIDNKNCH